MSLNLLEIDRAIDQLAEKYAAAEQASNEQLKQQIRSEYDALDLLRLVVMDETSAGLIQQLEQRIEEVESALRRLGDVRLTLGWARLVQRLGIETETVGVDVADETDEADETVDTDNTDDTDDADNSDSIGSGILLPGRPSIRLDPTGKIAVGTDGLTIAYKGVDNSPYGRTATRNKRAFRGIILHHTAPGKTAQWYVDYQHKGDSGRGGHHFGYHFYISRAGKILQGAPLTKRTNQISSKSQVRRKIGDYLHNTNSMGVSCVGAGKPSGFAPTKAQMETVRILVFALCDVFEISFADVYGHGEIQTNRMRSEGTSLAREIRAW